MKKIKKKFSIDFIFQSWVIIPKTDPETQKNFDKFLVPSLIRTILRKGGPEGFVLDRLEIFGTADE